MRDQAATSAGSAALVTLLPFFHLPAPGMVGPLKSAACSRVWSTMANAAILSGLFFTGRQWVAQMTG
mgnify:CR=1 FL=1